jgi:hypothetical protein
MIDADGVYVEYPADARTYENHTDAQRIQKHITISGAINIRRALRRMVEPKLTDIAAGIAALGEQLARVERKLDDLVSDRDTLRAKSVRH